MLEPTKKRYPTKKLQQDDRRGVITIKSNQIPAGRWPTNWRTIISKKFSHCCEGSESHFGLWSLGSQQRVWESPGNMTSKASRIWLQDFHRTGGTRDSRLGGHKQNTAHTKTQRKGAVTAQEAEPKLPARVGRLPVGAWAGSGHHRDGGTGSSSLRRAPLQ